ncbi:TetR/AcrR family transcriptional regulator [Streptomyces sp. NPDC101227]|uniref:TetR/AcrR family transcriptional regulator n=1 Tax=Streptomyces sp. NPDC101227 TaxID=3366136 RepID=UPI0037FED31A
MARGSAAGESSTGGTAPGASAPRGNAARELIAETALRLFAERGIDAVSLREITAASGQRNKSAAQYHFGDKERLILEIFERHTGRVNARRQAVLAELHEQHEQHPSLEDLVDALLRPLAETIDEHSHYLRFLAQVSLTPWTDTLVRADPTVTHSVQTVFTALAQLLDDLPEPVLRTRLALAMMLAVRALAACEQSMRPGNRGNARRVALLTANLVDSTIGILRAPVSEATRKLLPGAPKPPATDGWPWHLLLGAEAGL